MDLEIFSGEFTGYYSYNQMNDSDHEMHCSLVFFEDGRIVGHGVDDINPFHFEGKLDQTDNSILLYKKYPTHEVEYSGTLLNSKGCISISGIWTIKGVITTTGGFTLRKGHSRASVMADIDHIEKTLLKEFANVNTNL